jgi:hypothetical protein
MLIVTCDGTVNGFCLANPKLAGERKHAQQMLEHRPANRPGTAVVTDKGFAGEDFEGFRYFPNWLRQRVEAIIWTLKNQLGLERHGGRVPAGLWARVLHASWPSTPPSGITGPSAPIKRSLVAYDH